MKNLKFSALLALVLIALAASLRAEFLYVSYGKGLLSFSINRDTGALTKLPGTPTLFAGGIGSIVLDHTGTLLYASTDFDTQGVGQTIYGWRIGPNGRLIPLAGSPYKLAGNQLAIDPYNRFLYALNNVFGQVGSINVYWINHPTGSLSRVAGSPFATGSGPASIATDPFGRFLYVANNASQNISVYHVLFSGALTPVAGSPFVAGFDLIKVVTNPTGQFVYAASEDTSALVSYAVGPNGALIQLPGSPISLLSNWFDGMAINPLGGYLYVLASTSGLDVYRINNITRLPEQIQFLSVGNMLDNNPVGICVSPNGKFVYEGNRNGDPGPGPMTLRGFKVGSTGLLTLVPGSPYFPLGVGDYMRDPATFATEGIPSSMVVAP